MSIESQDSHSSVSIASSDSRLPTPTSVPQLTFGTAPPLENPFLVPAHGISQKHRHRKSHSRSSLPSKPVNGTNVKQPITDQQPKRKRSRTASAQPTQYGDLMFPALPQDPWRGAQSSPIRSPPTFDSVSHLNPQMLDSPFPPNYNSAPQLKSSPPSTPPSAFRRRPITGTGEEGADLLLFLATSPSPAQPPRGRFTSNITAPGTPPSMLRKAATTEPATPNQSFDVRDYINITPSPAPAVWNGGTPMIVETPTRRRLTYDDAVVSPVELGNEPMQ
jgi:hypothetical protein